MILALVAATSLLTPQAQKPKPKPVPPKPPTVGVKGAGQVAGGVVRFGDLIALKSGFTYQILSARYSIDPFDSYERPTAPADQKLLVLTVAIKNNRRDADNYFDATNHAIQAVGADGQNHEGGSYLLRTNPAEGFAPTLKPGQGLGQAGGSPVEIAIPVPLDARLVKLILKQGREGTGEEVVRYFLDGATEAEAGGKPDPANKIAPLPAWSEAGKTVPGGVFYPSHAFFFRLDGFAAADKLGEDEPEEGKHWVFAKVTVRNGGVRKIDLYEFHQGDSINDVVLIDTDGEKHRATRILKASRDETADGEFESREERTVRIGFHVPRDAKFKTILLGTPRFHMFVFDAADAGK